MIPGIPLAQEIGSRLGDHERSRNRRAVHDHFRDAGAHRGAAARLAGRRCLGTDARFAEIFAAHLSPEPPPPLNGTLARLMAEHYGDSYGTAGQALAMGGCWQELEARCIRDWEAFLAGELEPEFRAEATVRAHLAVAQAALGRPGPVHRYAETGGYWHRSSAIVPLLLSRWTDDAAVRAVFERLRYSFEAGTGAFIPDESEVASRRWSRCDRQRKAMSACVGTAGGPGPWMRPDLE
jgi:hypothetical protein